ncbi:MAG: tRNA guanosine(15) transglycosylase TgtA, partial [Nitrosopumilales archaeon CG_4_9_14_0_8_um_filter_34_10]
MFEILKSDLAGRIGIIHTNHGKIETPAYVPVIHPVKQTIPAKKIKEMGFDLVITNAYITRNNYGDEAVKKGIHEIIDFDGAIMTDSGGYQVLEYGDVKVLPPEMAEFERKILTDFAIPLDKPTGYGLAWKKAESYVNHTLKVSKKTLEDSEKNGQIWIGPIQGGEHFDLVAKSTKSLVDMGFQMLALGSPVEFMESYEYKLLAQMIISAKKQMPHSIPLHLFGAGHPLTIPFAVALGCDTFDSASYMLYAKQERYITDDGTRNLSDISVFPCNCEVCSKYTPDELRQLEGHDKINEIALHNLHAIK